MNKKNFAWRAIVSVWVMIWAADAVPAQVGRESPVAFDEEDERKNEPSMIALNCFFNPFKNYFAGTAILQFKEPSRLKAFSLGESLSIRSIRSFPEQKTDFFKQNDRFFLVGKDIENVNLYYSGTIETSGETDDLVVMPRRSYPNDIDLDRFYFLFRHQDFYPNTSGYFLKSRITVNVPAGLNCLASGTRGESLKRSDDTSAFTFESPMTKGISLVCGSFKQIARIPGTVPLNIYGSRNFDFPFYFQERELSGIIEFLTRLFGRLDMPEINILFRRSRSFGGVSHSGFIVYDIDAAYSNFNPNTWKNIRSDSPLTLHDIKKDNMVHELAHQWWGGIAACRSNSGVWITEGLAQFASLLYLEKNLSRIEFEQVIRRLKNWVATKSSVGAPVDGKKIFYCKHDLEAYQTIVYNKPALVMMMLRDILGEETTLARIRSFLETYKYRCVTAKEFIGHLCQGDEMLLRFFDGWIQKSSLPTLAYAVDIMNQDAEITAEQDDAELVFPVTVTIVTADGKTTRAWVIQKKRQRLHINLPSRIESVRIDSTFGPVRIIKNGRLASGKVE